MSILIKNENVSFCWQNYIFTKILLEDTLEKEVFTAETWAPPFGKHGPRWLNETFPRHLGSAPDRATSKKKTAGGGPCQDWRCPEVPQNQWLAKTFPGRLGSWLFTSVGPWFFSALFGNKFFLYKLKTILFGNVFLELVCLRPIPIRLGLNTQPPNA